MLLSCCACEEEAWTAEGRLRLWCFHAWLDVDLVDETGLGPTNLRTAHERCNLIRGMRKAGGWTQGLEHTTPCDISPLLLLRLNVHHTVSALLMSVFQELAVSLPKPRLRFLWMRMRVDRT
jgi:hypothetical protein